MWLSGVHPDHPSLGSEDTRWGKLSPSHQGRACVRRELGVGSRDQHVAVGCARRDHHHSPAAVLCHAATWPRPSPQRTDPGSTHLPLLVGSGYWAAVLLKIKSPVEIPRGCQETPEKSGLLSSLIGREAARQTGLSAVCKSGRSLMWCCQGQLRGQPSASCHLLHRLPTRRKERCH